MKDHPSISAPPVQKGRPDYYLTPTRDFTQFTRDSEAKYWNKETAFDWSQDVPQNLKINLEQLDPETFEKVTFMVIPMILGAVEQHIRQIRQKKLPLETEALKAIGECITFDRLTLHEVIQKVTPLKELAGAMTRQKDQLEILGSKSFDLEEQKRLGLFKEGNEVTQLTTEIQKQKQARQIAKVQSQIAEGEAELQQLQEAYQQESQRLTSDIRKEIDALEPQVLTDLEASRELINTILSSQQLPKDANSLALLKDLILKRQLRGLKDIANHALVVEQSAIAPLTMGIIHYKRYREIQEAMTTFINDEAKHSATFRRFLAEKLEAKEFISANLIKGADRYMWLARFMPGAGIFLAVIVEAIGAAYLEFFGKEAYMPDPLFRSISKTISDQDETRHMDLCVTLYNELFRKGTQWELVRNKKALKVMMRSVYGDKSEDHHLIQAFRAFGVESKLLYDHVLGRLSEQLARISVYVSPEQLYEYIG